MSGLNICDIMAENKCSLKKNCIWRTPILTIIMYLTSFFIRSTVLYHEYFCLEI